MSQETIKIVADLDSICRTCLCEKNSDELQNLFENSLDDLLLKTTSVQVCPFILT